MVAKESGTAFISPLRGRQGNDKHGSTSAKRRQRPARAEGERALEENTGKMPRGNIAYELPWSGLSENLKMKKNIYRGVLSRKCSKNHIFFKIFIVTSTYLQFFCLFSLLESSKYVLEVCKKYFLL